MLKHEMEIMLDRDDFVKIQILDFESFEQMKKSSSLTRIPTIKRHGVSRTFENNEKEIFIEFFDWTVLRIQSANDLIRLENVTLNSEFNWKLKLPITALVYIDEDKFNDLKQDSELIKEVGALNNIGEFYQLSNDFVLMKWTSQYYNIGKFSILEDIRNANGLDVELFYEGFFKEGELERKSESPIFKRKPIVFDNFDKELIKEGGEKIEKLLSNLSDWMNIDKSELDFSEKSFEKLDESLHWNWSGKSAYELVYPLGFYVGIAITKSNEEIELEIKEPYIGLKSTNGNQLDLLGEVARYLVDTDFGLPEIKPAFLNIQQELKTKER